MSDNPDSSSTSCRTRSTFSALPSTAKKTETGTSSDLTSHVNSGTKTRPKSKKLDRTLRELESAFAHWESLDSDSTANSAAHSQSDTAADMNPSEAQETERRRDANSGAAEFDPTHQELRKKTKKLLNQLRQQLAELND